MGINQYTLPHIGNSTVEYVSKEDLRLAYEQSINAYQSHVQRYNTWMNMYAIMTGALFVAFYSICGDNATKTPISKDVLLVLISILGLICSLCWLGAVKGHYEWMKNFMKILKQNEKRCFRDETLFVYTKVYPSCKKEDNDIKDCYLPGFFSTQKITLFFISLVVLAWIDILFLLAWKDSISIYWIILVLVGLLIVHVILYFFLYSYGGKSIHYLLEYFHSTIQPEEVIKN